MNVKNDQPTNKLETRVQKLKPPKRLWYATTTSRNSGKWMPKERFYLHKPYFPNVAEHCLCHVLYETPMEAFLGLRDELTKRNKNKMSYNVYMYSVEVKLITPNNYFPPSVQEERQLFTKDRDLLTRHLIRQSLNFVRCGVLDIPNSPYKPATVSVLEFKDQLGNWKEFCTIIKPTVKFQSGAWSGIQCDGLTKALFDFDEFEFKTEISLTEKKLLSEKKEVVNDLNVNLATSRENEVTAGGTDDNGAGVVREVPGELHVGQEGV